MAPLRYAAKLNPFLSLDCAVMKGVGAIWQPCPQRWRHIAPEKCGGGGVAASKFAASEVVRRRRRRRQEEVGSTVQSMKVRRFGALSAQQFLPISCENPENSIPSHWFSSIRDSETFLVAGKISNCSPLLAQSKFIARSCSPAMVFCFISLLLWLFGTVAISSSTVVTAVCRGA